MNIVLIGYRGSGKTSVGRKLAERLSLRFVDTDDLTCERFGTNSIAKIWEQHGEPEFRRTECQVVAEVMQRDGQVVGLGGGTLMQGPARTAVEHAKDTVRIYLQADAATLHERITADSRSRATRPNLTQHGGGLREIVTMLEEREPVYRAVADHTIDVMNIGVDDAVDKVVRIISMGA